ncbi:MAG TPA: DoxX family protein, partial [Pyrinomonadaceae bacterium]|nr:DoxX family protein [Pyrinomonadaceae bacterium]
MANLDSFQSKWGPRLLSVLRIVAGFLLMQHGMQKLLGLPAPMPTGTVPLLSLFGFVGVLELGGGLLLLLGLFTRPVAFVLSGLLAAAYFMAHAPQGFWPLLNQGELAALYSFVFLYLAVAGGGAWALDRLLRRGRTV